MAQRQSTDALLIIDVINDLEFPGGEKILPWAQRMVPHLSLFADRARRMGIPVVYANDNFGHWRSNFGDVFRHCTRDGARGAEIAQALKPDKDDYFILKPRQSAFFATSLVPLLSDLGTRRLILSGIATNLCVTFTANDAHMHGYDLVVLSDCCAAERDGDHDRALDQLQRFLNAHICRSADWNISAEMT